MPIATDAPATGLAHIEAALRDTGTLAAYDALPRYGEKIAVPMYQGRGPRGPEWIALHVQIPTNADQDDALWKIIDERSGEVVLAREGADFLARDLAALIARDRITAQPAPSARGGASHT